MSPFIFSIEWTDCVCAPSRDSVEVYFIITTNFKLILRSMYLIFSCLSDTVTV